MKLRNVYFLVLQARFSPLDVKLNDIKIGDT